jgi:glucokinase
MYNIGIDLGGTNIVVALVSSNGEIIKKKSTPTLKERSMNEIIKDMGTLSIELISEIGCSLDEINSVGIGSPGIPDPKNGILVYANNLNIDNTPIRDELQKYINKPVYVENDANVAALGEYEYGGGKKYKDLVAITLGTGIGGGVIIDGKIIGGSFNGGAELGHIVLQVGGEKCSCGRLGCWEQYSSATALIREAKKAVEKNHNSIILELCQNKLDNINAKMVFDAKELGDTTAKELIDRYLDYLAIGLVNIINIYQPEVIVIGGGISAQKDKLITPLKEKMVREIYGGEDFFKTSIKIATLGNDAGLIGAAMLYKYIDNN